MDGERANGATLGGVGRHRNGHRPAGSSHASGGSIGELPAGIATARVRSEGCTGIRRIRIRDFQLLSDTGPDCAGFDAGPTAAELQLAALGSCLTQTFLAEAAARHIPIDTVELDVIGRLDPRDGSPHDVHYSARLTSPASADDLAALHEAVQRTSAILNLLTRPQQVHGTLVHDPAARLDAPDLVRAHRDTN